MEGKLRTVGKTAGRMDDERLDTILQALSHRTRRAILEKLATGPVMVRDLAGQLHVSRFVVMKHLNVLEHAQLVSRTEDRRIRRSALSITPLEELEEWLKDRQSTWEGSEGDRASVRFAMRQGSGVLFD